MIQLQLGLLAGDLLFAGYKKEKDAIASFLDPHCCRSRELLLPPLTAGPIAGQHVRIALALETS
jgi:hypothetical protein